MKILKKYYNEIIAIIVSGILLFSLIDIFFMQPTSVLSLTNIDIVEFKTLKSIYLITIIVIWILFFISNLNIKGYHIFATIDFCITFVFSIINIIIVYLSLIEFKESDFLITSFLMFLTLPFLYIIFLSFARITVAFYKTKNTLINVLLSVAIILLTFFVWRKWLFDNYEVFTRQIGQAFFFIELALFVTFISAIVQQLTRAQKKNIPAILSIISILLLMGAGYFYLVVNNDKFLGDSFIYILLALIILSILNAIFGIKYNNMLFKDEASWWRYMKKLAAEESAKMLQSITSSKNTTVSERQTFVEEEIIEENNIIDGFLVADIMQYLENNVGDSRKLMNSPYFDKSLEEAVRQYKKYGDEKRIRLAEEKFNRMVR